MSGRHTFLADAVIGAHGDFAEWIFRVIREIAAVARRTVVQIDRFDTIDYVLNPRPIIISAYPSNQLVDSIDRRDVRVLFVMEPPTLTLAFMQQKLGLTAMDAIRSQSASSVANLAISRSPYSRILERETDRSILQIVNLIVTHFELELSHADQLAVAENVSDGHGSSASVEALLRGRMTDVAAIEPVPGDHNRPFSHVAEEVLNPLLAIARFGPIRPVVWPKEVFTFFDNPTASPPIEAAVAGPSRNLFYGPYFYLPPSRYRVETFLVFSEEISAIPFVLEVHAANWLARARIDQHHPGRFRGTFNLDHYDATSAVEIRLRNVKPVERGRLTLLEILFFCEPLNPD